MRQCIRKIGIFSLGMGSNAYRRKKKKIQIVSMQELNAETPNFEFDACEF